MQFIVIDRWGNVPEGVSESVVLSIDDWNDYSYYTTFGINYVDKKGDKLEIGFVKIGFKGQTEGERVLSIGDKFEQLNSHYFSVGGSEDYYEILNTDFKKFRDEILIGLNDISKNDKILQDVINERVFEKSFLRGWTIHSIRGQLRRMANGGARLTDYNFSFIQKSTTNDVPDLNLRFEVAPGSLPPSNIHVLIGRNGVGKTTLLKGMIKSFLANSNPDDGQFFFDKSDSIGWEANSFANLIWLSFSAFDGYENSIHKAEFSNNIMFSYIGLNRFHDKNENSSLKSHNIIATEFLQSLNSCKSKGLKERWINAIKSLSSDKKFEDGNIIDMINGWMTDEQILMSFNHLSSGHKIILLSITQLVEKLREKTLVIMDEPESHLHPPLIAAFIRVISNLLQELNAVAIIATHSPVILQEVPKSCVWKLSNSNTLIKPERPSKETFGENVGILTDEAFGLEVENSGFYNLLKTAVKENDYNYDAIIEAFNNQLGMEAKSLIMSLISRQSMNNDQAK